VLWLLDIEVARRDVTAKLGESERDGFAEADSRSGDERHPPAQIEQLSNVYVSCIHDSNLAKLNCALT
jgi:hypothetical protein